MLLLYQEAEVERVHFYQSLALVSCRQTIASLQKLIGDLQKAQPQKSRLEQSAAEVVIKKELYSVAKGSF